MGVGSVPKVPWFQVSGFGARVLGPGLRREGIPHSHGLRFMVSGLGFQVSGFGLRCEGAPHSHGLWFMVSGFGFRVSGFGSRDSGFGLRAYRTRTARQSPPRGARLPPECLRTRTKVDEYVPKNRGINFRPTQFETRFMEADFENNCFTEMCCGSEAGLCKRLGEGGQERG